MSNLEISPCPGVSSYDCKLGTCHGLPQCGGCCKCLGRCYIEAHGAKLVEEFELKEPEKLKIEGPQDIVQINNKPAPGTTLQLTNEDMIKPWINHTILVTLEGSLPVPAKIIEVNSHTTKVVVVKEIPKT